MCKSRKLGINNSDLSQGKVNGEGKKGNILNRKAISCNLFKNIQQNELIEKIQGYINYKRRELKKIVFCMLRMFM